MIPDGCSVILNIGTTTEEVARALVGHRDLVVITNNLNVVSILSGTPGKDIILTGGIVRQSDGAIVGDEAVEFIRKFKADFAVIGCSALDEDGAIMDYDLREVAVARAIVENARRTILVCDRLKFERTAPIRICSAADIHAFVTDAPPPPAFVEVCARAGVAIEIAGGRREAPDDGPGRPAGHRRRRQRLRHRPRRGRARADGAAGRAGRPGAGDLVGLDQAVPRRAALPRVLRVPAGPRSR